MRSLQSSGSTYSGSPGQRSRPHLRRPWAATKPEAPSEQEDSTYLNSVGSLGSQLQIPARRCADQTQINDLETDLIKPVTFDVIVRRARFLCLRAIPFQTSTPMTRRCSPCRTGRSVRAGRVPASPVGGSDTIGKSDMSFFVYLLTVRYVASLCEGFCLVHRLDNTSVVVQKL